jgi:hypothetical protein
MGEARRKLKLLKGGKEEMATEFDPKDLFSSLIKGTVIFEAKADNIGNVIINCPTIDAKTAMSIILNMAMQIIFQAFEPKSQLIVGPR